MYCEEKNWDKFTELKHKIQEAGFLEQTFSYKDPADNKTYQLLIHNKIRRRGTAQGQKATPSQFKRNPKRNIRLSNHNLIFDHKQLMKATAGINLLQELKEDNLSEEKDNLLKKGYSKEAIKAALQVLENDLDKRLERFRDTQDYKYFVFPEDSPFSHAWISRENGAISNIRHLYKKHTPLTDRQIRYNMALVFEAIAFWPYDDKGTLEEWLERRQAILKKRFNKIKKYPVAFPSDDEISRLVKKNPFKDSIEP